MPVKTKLKDAQKKIIDYLVLCEESIAALYEIYSEKVPEYREFWQEISAEEIVHAGLLATMYGLLEKGHIFYGIGRFDKNLVFGFLTKVGEEIAFARENPVSALHAMQMAVFIETSVLEAHFYEVITSDAAEFRFVAERLADDTHNHVQIVQFELRELEAGNRKKAKHENCCSLTR